MMSSCAVARWAAIALASALHAEMGISSSPTRAFNARGIWAHGLVPAVTVPQVSDQGEAEESAGQGVPSEAKNTVLYRVCRVTAYCDRGTTASGVESGVGQCAAPIYVPFGSELYIPELDQTFVATDRTAKRFRHNTVDIFMPDRRQCLEFGVRYLRCEIRVPSQVTENN